VVTFGCWGRIMGRTLDDAKIIWDRIQVQYANYTVTTACPMTEKFYCQNNQHQNIQRRKMNVLTRLLLGFFVLPFPSVSFCSKRRLGTLRCREEPTMLRGSNFALRAWIGGGKSIYVGLAGGGRSLEHREFQCRIVEIIIRTIEGREGSVFGM
jgi:hypothetical protein